MDRPSGDQKGEAAPSVPASGCAVVVASDRSQIRDAPSLEATYTMCLPSGERANESGADVAGVLISTRVSAGATGGTSVRCRTAGTASAAATAAASATSAHGTSVI